MQAPHKEKRITWAIIYPFLREWFLDDVYARARRNSEFFALAIALFFLCAGSYALSRASSSYLQNLGPNLLAGFIGSAFTIFGFDLVLRRREKRLRRPIRAAIYNDVCRLCRTACIAYIERASAVPRGTVYGWKGALLCVLNDSHFIESQPGEIWLASIREKAERMLERYMVHLEPEMVEQLQHIAAVDLRFLGDIGLRRNGLPTEQQRWLDTIVELHDWTWREFNRGELRISEPIVPWLTIYLGDELQVGRFKSECPPSPEQQTSQ